MQFEMRRSYMGKVAFVTGAANGIGRATAPAFAREGAKVVLADISERGNEETDRSGADQAHGQTRGVRGRDALVVLGRGRVSHRL